MSDDLSQDIGSQLPSPRDDEPASLRQDIIDELSDHLQCAARREQLKESAHSPSENRIQQQVLNRFGCPAALARQLWFDWMWEKIAMQRLSIALMIAVLLCCGALLYFIVQSTQATQSALLAAQHSQQELLEKMLELSQRPLAAGVSNQPAEWNNLKIKLVYDDEQHTPVPGVKVEAWGASDNNRQIRGLMETSGPDGTVDLGTVLYGEYQFFVDLPNGLNSDLKQLTVRPGQDKLHEIVCPKYSDKQVSLKPVLPEFFSDKPMFTQGQLWYRVACELKEPVRNTGEFWEYAAPEGERFTTFWISSQGVHNSIAVEAAKSTDLELPFPAETLLLTNAGPAQPAIALKLGVQQVRSVSLFLQENRSDGKTYLVGVPDVPMNFIGNLPMLRDDGSDMSSSMGGGGYPGFSGGSAYGAEMMYGEEMYGGGTGQPRYLSVPGWDTSIIGVQLSNLWIAPGLEGETVRELFVNPYEPLLFWLASQTETGQQLLLIPAKSDVELEQGFQTQQLRLRSSIDEALLGDFRALYTNTSPETLYYNEGPLKEMKLMYQILISVSPTETETLQKSFGEIRKLQGQSFHGFLVYTSEQPAETNVQ